MLSRLSALWHVPIDFVGHLRSEAHVSHPNTYWALRSAYLLTRGRSRRVLRALFALLRPSSRAPDVGHAPILQALRGDGIALLPGFLPIRDVTAIRDHLSRQEGFLIGEHFSKTPARLDAATPGLRLTYSCETVLAAPGVAELLHSPFFQDLAGAYLGCVPIFTGIHAWWSLPDPQASAADLSLSAQEFHFDYDWGAFVKFFIYLTDVDARTGPFVYVTGTHERKHEWRDGRIDTARIEATYGAQVREVCGGAGDLIVADTAGYHKGKRVVQGRRLILQFEFAVSRLGASCQYEPLPRRARPQGLARHTFDAFSGADPGE